MSLEAGRAGGREPLIVGHRGACGYRPEHTVESYLLAARLGADSLEPDLVMTSDGQLICRHEPELSRTTDVATRAEFADRRTTRRVGESEATGWFAEDFTLAEIGTLWATERLAQLRPSNTIYHGRCRVASFDDLLRVRAQVSRELGREIGLSVELKDPSRYRAMGMDMERAVLDGLRRGGAVDGSVPAYLQSFELHSLIRLRDELGVTLPLIFLLENGGVPPGFGSGAHKGTYDELLSARGLKLLSTWIDGVGPGKARVFPRRTDGTLGMPSRLVRDAHAAGLLVHVWTFRAENAFLAEDMRRGGREADWGDVLGEMRRFLRAGVDALICDQPDLAVLARDEMLSRLPS
ncbi:glycerophosphodiester phosphodiesterase family protein [Allobranchiibius sp. CTAmp26]|uniref:glycerophosphodiester phosphodiesterase family protein n=1 Tax=Allobranchiibius sp. CTAmp26 TaxID=2815214 RepID=UPI001AA15BC1|nr:glycerophosphodiester phosphodiesterase family protein [Allobranchiibius sp. CTAmp26]MBO1754517.1 glycerophosphodiester phosphodiesterase [Allobranchiibius sp. CTAmp26]